MRNRTAAISRLIGITLAIVLLAAATGSAGFDPGKWRWRKSVLVAGASAGYAEIPLDADVYDRATRSLDDIRVVSAAGEEVPYVIRRWPASETMVTVSAPMVNLSVQPRRLTRFEVQTLRPGQRHNQVRITIAGTEFLPRQAAIEGSDDRKAWFVLSRGEVYRFAQGAEVDSVSYPNSVYRFVRVTIHDDGRPGLQVEGGALRFRQVSAAREDRWFAGPVEATTATLDRTTAFVIDTGFARLPIARMTVTVTAPAAFVRPADVEVSADRTSWQQVASTTFVRTGQAGKEEPIVITFDEARARFVRLTVRNGDNPPLQIVRASVHGIQRTVLFPIASGKNYWLYFAGPADPPQYDLPEVLRREATPPRPVVGSLGGVEANPAFAPPLPPRRPWTEEHPSVLWAIIGGVGVALVVLIVNTIRATRSRTEP